jgi:hypothetical protein
MAIENLKKDGDFCTSNFQYSFLAIYIAQPKKKRKKEKKDAMTRVKIVVIKSQLLNSPPTLAFMVCLFGFKLFNAQITLSFISATC